MDVYIGNLPFTCDEQELRDLLTRFGQPSSVRIVNDRDTGRSRGFAFASFDDEAEARAAIAELNGREMGGRTLVVNEAQRGQDRGRGGPRGGGGGGGYRGSDRGGSSGGRGGRY